MGLTAQDLVNTLGPLRSQFSAGELQQLVFAITSHSHRCVRPRPELDFNQLPFATRPVPWSRLGHFLVDSQVRPGSYLQFSAGDYAVQDAASLLPLSLMDLRSGQQVIDLCAAPGGKSAAILEQLQGSGLLVSNEVIASRVDTLQLTLARTGWNNLLITHQPVERLTDVFADQFDIVLVDAPCTGQSLVARGKQTLSAFSERQVAHSAARQASILKSAWPMVRPGGRLIYSTCTFAFDENEAIVEQLRAWLPQWQPVVIDQLSPWQSPGLAGCYRLWPHRDGCAGGFAAGLERPLHGSQETLMLQECTSTEQPSSKGPRVKQSYRRSTSSRSGSTSWQSVKDVSLSESWGQFTANSAASSGKLLQNKQHVSWFSPQLPEAWFDVAHAGVEVAVQFGQHWQPAYPLATLNASLEIFEPHASISLNDTDAICYMSGGSLHLNNLMEAVQSNKSGRGRFDSQADCWLIVLWRGRTLGWGKLVGNQLKNHLPKPLRQLALKY